MKKRYDSADTLYISVFIYVLLITLTVVISRYVGWCVPGLHQVQNSEFLPWHPWALCRRPSTGRTCRLPGTRRQMGSATCSNSSVVTLALAILLVVALPAGPTVCPASASGGRASC